MRKSRKQLSKTNYFFNSFYILIGKVTPRYRKPLIDENRQEMKTVSFSKKKKFLHHQKISLKKNLLTKKASFDLFNFPHDEKAPRSRKKKPINLRYGKRWQEKQTAIGNTASLHCERFSQHDIILNRFLPIAPMFTCSFHFLFHQNDPIVPLN